MSETETSAYPQWKPIETAPKDGTPILLWGGEDSDAYYFLRHEQYLASAPCRAAWVLDCWLITLAEAGFVAVTYDNPTHWMPLPPPPTERTEHE